MTPPTRHDPAREWAALAAILAEAGLDVERFDHPGQLVADALLLLRSEHLDLVDPTAYADMCADDEIRTQEVTVVNTAAGPVTVGYTDTGELTLALEQRSEIHVIPFDTLVRLFAAPRSAPPAGRPARVH